ncbi:DNA topoisomerase IB [Micromonospora sp. KC721]|uniref:DNA topoisomerase IB n=1 Tax=Micromonospora sp. KC721 TaxID=2530380 RepID=UPI001053A955|nr:DNA topoisomerase IB [Micromonospora sp. KC721]TDB81132.1 DNA topoisomerase IB [Micromonospora sp. KC721]
MRLRRSDPGRAGYGRRRAGRGWVFLNPQGEPVRDPQERARLRDLVIPPAWQDVWISPYPNGHIQATGIDAAGRKQYLYHPQWRRRRDEAKFDHVLEVARRLPALRARIARDLDGHGLHRERVLATVTRLLDMGMFRVGNGQYAVGEDATFGVSTLRPEHARFRGGCVVFEFPAKGGIEQVRRIEDPELCRVLTALRRRRRGEQRLFGYRDGGAWRDVRSDEINDYLREASGGEMTAKDFRTWHATVLAATELATVGRQRSATARRRAVAAVMRAVAELLGNTPTVARTSYVDPRVVDLYHDGVLVPVGRRASRDEAERAVLTLLQET